MIGFLIIWSLIFAASEACMCCPANEVYSQCGNNACQNTCAAPNKAIGCKACCVPGCICVRDYLRNSKGVCVPAANCDTCSINQIFDLTKATECQNTCAEPNKESKCVPKMPLAGCICAKGYVRNDKGVCTRLDDCGCGGDMNAEWNPCGDPCPITCANQGNIGSCDPTKCISGGGCKCKCGFVRNIYGKCIPKCQCPICGTNEVFDCGSGCDTTCATLGEPCAIISCKCTEMCYCKPGYARDSNKVCIPVDKCPPKQCKTDPNAIELPCGDPSPITCENMFDPPPPPSDKCIKNGCKCNDGYVLGPKGLCIKREECACNGDMMAIWDPCGDPCPITCSNRGDIGSCDTTRCKCGGGCKCRKGCALNCYGKCIPQCECRTCPQHEVLTCGIPCDNFCATLGEPCPNVTPKHVENCYCKTGYARDSNNQCIPVEKCPPKQCKTDPNAIELPCGDPSPITCENMFDPPPPPMDKCIENGCKCNEGYVLGPKGLCIKREECACNGDMNAVWDPCGDPCPVTCSNRGDIGLCDTTRCKDGGGCKCRKGFALDCYGKCIPQYECRTCGSHEVLTCGSPCDNFCATLGEPCLNVVPKHVENCYCKPGYARDCNNLCIPIEKCPPKQCKTDQNAIELPCGDPTPITCENMFDPPPAPSDKCIKNGCKCNEGYVLGPKGLCIKREECACNGDMMAIWDPCGDPCPITCSNRGDIGSCDTTKCKCGGGCKCRKGFALNCYGKCIPQCECRTCPQHEVLTCGSPCDNFCATLGEPCLNVVPKHVENCNCKPGYARDSNNVCIPVEKCPPKQCKTDPNAIELPCGDPTPITCENMFDPPPPPSDKCIKNGCKCNEGYVLGPKGLCIKREECACNGDMMAIWDPCGDPCPITCSNRGDIGSCDTTKCKCGGGCKCRKGFALNCYGKCIPQCECRICGNNEVLTCGSPCDNFCATLGEPCLNVVPKHVENCYCKTGYARDSNNVCIPVEKCPPKQCKTDPNAIELPCGDPSPITCENMFDPPPPPSDKCIKNGCKCNEGYVLGPKGLCIKREECACNGDMNAIWDPCGDPCPITCSNRGDIGSCDTTRCKYGGGCKCRKGFALNCYGKCIPQCECRTCPQYEVLTCGSPCDNFCATLGEPCLNVVPKHVENCYCKTGYARDSNNVCIPVEKCPPKQCKTDPNAIELPCGDPTPITCENMFDPPRPPSDKCIKNGCKCNDGYVLGPKGLCIKREECACNGDMNAIWDPCGDPCPITCSNRGDIGSCDTTRCKCGGGCKCRKGFALNCYGKCIPQCECRICGNNEVLTCGSPCDNFCATLGEPCLNVVPKHVENCYCKPGYARDSNKVCIPVEKCPPKQCKTDPNAIELPCGDPSPITCENMFDPPSPPSDKCIKNGCKCNDGYVLGPKGLCIKREECACNGDINAIWDPCGDPCPVTCTNRGDIGSCDTTRCKCGGGCKCRKGFALNCYGKCIPQCECRTCGNNEVLTCGSPCDNFCATLGEPCLNVVPKHVENCYCKPGYARDCNNQCIPVEKCPPKQCKTDPNAIELPCGDPSPITCENMYNPPKVCPTMCIVNGCKCISGYVLGPNGKCILPKYCPPPPTTTTKCPPTTTTKPTTTTPRPTCGCTPPPLKCKANEVVDPCPVSCPPEQTCDNYGVIFSCEPPPLNRVCVPACRCAKGYVRNCAGICVLPQNCCSDLNAEFIACPNPCPGGTCACPTFCACKAKCQPYGCQCKKGYVKTSDTNPKCILQSSCYKCGCQG